jgi:hypothetical protein
MPAPARAQKGFQLFNECAPAVQKLFVLYLFLPDTKPPATGERKFILRMRDAPFAAAGI